MKKLIITTFLLGLGSTAYADNDSLADLLGWDDDQGNQQQAVNQTLSTPPAVGDSMAPNDLDIFFIDSLDR